MFSDGGFAILQSPSTIRWDRACFVYELHVRPFNRRTKRRGNTDPEDPPTSLKRASLHDRTYVTDPIKPCWSHRLSPSPTVQSYLLRDADQSTLRSRTLAVVQDISPSAETAPYKVVKVAMETAICSATSATLHLLKEDCHALLPIPYYRLTSAALLCGEKWGYGAAFRRLSPVYTTVSLYLQGCTGIGNSSCLVIIGTAYPWPENSPVSCNASASAIFFVIDDDKHALVGDSVPLVVPFENVGGQSRQSQAGRRHPARFLRQTHLRAPSVLATHS